MEKNIFDTALDSMMASTAIEVEGVGMGLSDYEAIPPVVDKEKEAASKKAEEDKNKDLIDLDDDKNEEVEDEEKEEAEEEISEEPSSSENSPHKSKSKTSSPLTPYAQLLVDEGVLPNLDVKKFDGTADSLKEAMVNEIIGAVDSYKDSLPERIKNLINNYEDGISFEKLLQLDSIETDISKVTEEKLEEDTSLQKKIVGDYLKRTTKFSETKISKLVDGYEDSGELEDEAKSSLEELKGIVTKEKDNELKNVTEQKKVAEDNRKKELSTLQEKIKTSTEIIPGMKLNDKVRNNVFASMTTPVGYDQNGRPVNKIVAARMENPVDFELKLHYLFEITKGFTDFTKLSEKGKKDASKQFEEAVNNMDNNHFDESEHKDEQVKKRSLDFIKSLSKTYNL